jgi:hypothetical protein
VRRRAGLRCYGMTDKGNADAKVMFGISPDDEETVIVNGTLRRRCTATSKRTGERCKGFVVHEDRQVCRVHGVTDGRYFGALTVQEAQQKRVQKVRARVELREALARTGPLGPRAALKVIAAANAHALASQAVESALSEGVPEGERGRLALAVIREADPAVETSLNVELLNTPIEDVPNLGMSQLRQLAALVGGEPAANSAANEGDEADVIEGEAQSEAESETD